MQMLWVIAISHPQVEELLLQLRHCFDVTDGSPQHLVSIVPTMAQGFNFRGIFTSAYSKMFVVQAVTVPEQHSFTHSQGQIFFRLSFIILPFFLEVKLISLGLCCHIVSGTSRIATKFSPFIVSDSIEK